MLQVSIIREQKEQLLNGLKIRNFPADEFKIVDEIIALDDLRRPLKPKMMNSSPKPTNFLKILETCINKAKETRPKLKKMK